VFGGAIIPYVVPYPYYVYPPYDGYSVPTVPTPVVPGAGYGASGVPSARYAAAGVSAGPSTYYTDLANQPGASSGVTFQVSPAAAEVFVDGVYVGTVQDFWADLEPLMLVTGSHRIELRAPGYRTATLDVTTTPGQVIPFAGELEPLQ
jgi:PEGA domain-containing protein